MECSVERDQRLMQLVSAALQKPAAQRDSYLRLACPNDPELLQEASDVIKGEEQMAKWLLSALKLFVKSAKAEWAWFMKPSTAS